MDPVKIGLVGYGFGGRYFHAPLIASAEECAFIGVVTRSDQRRALVDAEHPGVTTYDSLEALADAGAEAVAVSTPADTHSSVTDQAIELGPSVVCDKPFALDPAARKTVALASARGVTLTSGSAPVSLERGAWDTFYPAFARAVRGEGAPPVEAADAVATADVLEAARVSAEQRVAVRPGAG